ncbi:MAG: hypothetical protein IV090_17995 [Candidatus Sericytochromatia bacterium]|nr:hypothetical protein [Candidatus Sericytochromatia bacterium]
MLSRERILDLIENLPEEDFKVVARVVESLAAAPAKPAVSPSEFARLYTPVKPPRIPLAKQFGALMQQTENSNDYEQMLKKNLYTRLSDLMNWINQPSPPQATTALPQKPDLKP